jgi:ketosteroid isomerase-like protein
MPDESTTPDLVEITLGIFEAMDRDWDIDAVAAHWSPDVVWETLGGTGTYEGAAAVRLFMEGWWSTWEDHRHHVEEIRDLGHGVVYVVVREEGHLVGSSAAVEQRAVGVFVWVDGRVARIVSYLDIDEGRAAAERLAEERG